MHELCQTCAAAVVALSQQTIYAGRCRSCSVLPAINNQEPPGIAPRTELACKRGTAEL
jgi:hypothetical protein